MSQNEKQYTDLFYSNVSNELNEIDEIFQEWCVCYKNFCGISETVPHLSKPEQTSLGIFAGAACRKDWVSFQEMRIMKSRKDGSSWGYSDLWIRKNENSGAYYFESKGNCIESKDNAEHVLKKAIKDAKKLIINDLYPTKKIALAFCCIQLRDNNSNIDTAIKKIISQIEDIPHDAISYCFPAYSELPQDGRYLFPGTIVLAKIVDDE